MADIDDELIELAAECAADPLRWALHAYDWGRGELEGVTGPRAWQREVMSDIGNHLKNPATRFQPLMLAVASGHGIGKSAEIGMIVNWALSTCDDCKVVITANTDTQLRTKTSPEVGKWQRLSITSHWFDPQSASIAARDKEHAKTWRADFVPWSEHNTEAFAGLHNKGKRIVLIFDEASAIADKVWEVAEGALTDEGTEIIWIAFGNPTRNIGRFRECFRRFRHRWVARQIDSRTVEGTNKEQIAKWAEDYGEESDFFKVRVRGMFPSMSARQFISETDVSAAYGRALRPEQYQYAPKILTVDPAWEGDDEFVIGLRQGLLFRILHTMAKNDNDLVAAQVIARYEDEENADAVFVDAGFGTGIVSAGKSMGRDWTLVWFAGNSMDAGCLNKRAEMWRDARDWLKSGGAIPDDPVLRDELQAPEIVPRLDGKIQIESKKEMKARGVPSPNRADALILSFAYPVTRRDPLDALRNHSERREYDPYA
ncbi:terminase [Laribacter hongkongensis]|uniref:terminase n=1 Tax=Laribacter hongkongensis TaxID=168471 RepID=UPI001EFC9A72|nr:terminase [Laribacter hongkongensis]MCG9097825.1 terminase [Laribacter hongkongensis]